MSVDKTIEELSYTLAQLGTLVGHINSQVGQLASRLIYKAHNFNLLTIIRFLNILKIVFVYCAMKSQDQPNAGYIRSIDGGYCWRC